jgi:opacity protein-like surface antigen
MKDDILFIAVMIVAMAFAMYAETTFNQPDEIIDIIGWNLVFLVGGIGVSTIATSMYYRNKIKKEREKWLKK